MSRSTRAHLPAGTGPPPEAFLVGREDRLRTRPVSHARGRELNPTPAPDHGRATGEGRAPTAPPRQRRLAEYQRVLAAATAALLAIDAYVHLRDAGLYDGNTTAILSQGTLFRVQAAVAVVVALMLVLRRSTVVWAIAVLVAASAAGAVLLYTAVDVGPLGPLPNMYEPTWALPGKGASAAAEAAATVFALTGLGLALGTRPRRAR
jgi:hypothetical protein